MNEYADTEAPLRVADAGQIHWDGVADVVVVGFGGAGACAALEAAHAGAAVLVLDCFGGGGATARSGGVVYAGETELQRRAGVTDSTGEMFKYLVRELQGVVPDDVVQRYCTDSPGSIDWLVDHGVRYNTEVCLDKTDYPAGGESLYFAGNEKRADHAAIARPAPRGHRPEGPGFTGHAYFSALRSAVIAHGATVITHARVVRLVQDAAGAVIGVEALVLPEQVWKRHDRLCARVGLRPFNAGVARRSRLAARSLEAQLGERRRFRALGGVILATGGYASNPDMLRRHNPGIAAHTDAMIHLATLGCDGSGILLGQSVGGGVGCMENLQIVRNLTPDPLRCGLLVNRQGQRFINEDAYNGDVGKAIAAQPGAQASLVLDRTAFLAALRACVSCPRGTFLHFGLPSLVTMLFGGTRVARTLPRLAAKCGWDSALFTAQVQAHNAATGCGKPDPLGKAQDAMAPLTRGPFFAVDVSPGNPLGFTFMFTLGGLTVDVETGAVTDTASAPVAGLFAAGRSAVGFCSKGYVSGMSLGDGIFSGRRAAARAVARARGASQG